jgi:hypothetical protein
MNTAIDITSAPVRWRQFDADELVSKRDQRRASYVDDWARGNLYDDGKVYSRPMELLAEDDWLAQLLLAEGDDELLAAAKIVKAQLLKFVEEQAREAV